MTNCNPVNTPAEPGKVYSKVQPDEASTTFMQDKPYRNLACSLLYPANITRPDTAWACNNACRFLQNPSKEHWQLVQRIVRYVKGSKDLALKYCAELPPIVSAFPDASWADDIEDRRSTGAYLFFIGSCLISWSCKKQNFVALSTNNAEFAAMSDACKEARFIRGLLSELAPSVLPPEKPIFIFEDNQGAIAQANSNILNNANRTIALKFHHVREEITKQRVLLVPISSQDQLGDILTKSLSPSSLERLRIRIFGGELEWWKSVLKPLLCGM